MSSSTSKIGPLGANIVAAIAAGGIFVCIALIVIIAVIMDLPKRMKQRKEKEDVEAAEKQSLEISGVEKGSGDASTMAVSSTNVSTNFSSIRPTRPASPECTCEHPVVLPHPPRV